MKTFVFGMLAGALALVFGVVLYLRLGFAEARGDLAPGVLESKLMTAARCMLPFDGKRRNCRIPWRRPTKT